MSSQLKGVTPDAIPYPRSNDLLAKYQEEIAQLQVVAKEKRNGTHDISQNKSIDELADWLVGPVKGSKPKESEEILPTTFDEWADKQEWLRKENSERHEDGSIWWFSRRIPKLASKKVKNEHGFGYWHLAREAYKPHITNNYAKKIRDLMDDDEEYVIGPSLCAHFYGKASLDELLLIDKRGWLSWKDSDAIKFNEYQDEPYNLELEGLPYTLRFQFMACSRQKLYGPGIHEDGTVWWHSDELVRVSYKMASEVCHLLYNSTEYTLFIRLYTSESIVEEMGDKGWHFGKKKKAGSLTGEEITLGQLEGINIFLRAKTQEYVNHICYELRPVPRPQGPPGPFYDGDLNCIIAELQRLIEHGGTKRAIGLTPARESALAKFNEKVRAPGCTLDDLHILEKLEKSGGIGMKIVVKDILGNEMWNSDRYLKQLYDMDYECERALISACMKTKKGEVNIDEKKIAEALISFVARNLPRATRIWIVGKEILTHEGILYRSSHEWKKLNDAFICEKLQSIPEELLWEANVDIRQWIEDEYQSNTLAPSEEFKAEFNKVLKSLGGTQSYRFCCWQEKETIAPTPRNVVEI
ncbi:hypothetical protein GLOIN_2v1477001 [Rhizophagus clarus]|uniref:Uncharacterized protein n=1 Tax=Rhizophagus clarus TaxID=94130 RepID=A0A8H3LJC1_9GLOM|nr:hypothetical protein GLOIN_2v1477001 [Rhizophagus clarus]